MKLPKREVLFAGAPSHGHIA